MASRQYSGNYMWWRGFEPGSCCCSCLKSKSLLSCTICLATGLLIWEKSRENKICKYMYLCVTGYVYVCCIQGIFLFGARKKVQWEGCLAFMCLAWVQFLKHYMVLCVNIRAWSSKEREAAKYSRSQESGTQFLHQSSRDHLAGTVYSRGRVS